MHTAKLNGIKISITAKSALIDTKNYSKQASQKNMHAGFCPSIIGNIL
jgi:hypothetical protein